MGTITAQRTGSGVVSTKASQLEIKELEAVKAFAANGDASKSKEPSEEFVYGMIFKISDLHVKIVVLLIFVAY